MNKDSYQFFKTLQFDKLYDRVQRPIIIADQIRTPENMGSILRLAGNIGAQNVYFISDVADKFKSYKIKKTASGADEKISWKIISLAELPGLIPANYSIIALETTPQSKNIFNTALPQNIAFMVGNEVNGMSEKILEIADQQLFIPILGSISSLNVSHTLSIALFEWLRQVMNP